MVWKFSACQRSRGYHRPVVFVSGKGDIPISVRAMKAGAIDFLTKPVKDRDLFEAVARAEARDAESRRFHSEIETMLAKVSTLTPREREVFTHVVAGGSTSRLPANWVRSKRPSRFTAAA